MALLSALAFTTSFGQDIINNFQVENSEIIWQKVFETELSFEALTEKVKNSE